MCMMLRALLLQQIHEASKSELIKHTVVEAMPELLQLMEPTALIENEAVDGAVQALLKLWHDKIQNNCILEMDKLRE
jgi:hypothetical protein